ncbi:MAG: hypothetical protein ACPGTP_06195, partial [Bacteroidia bacterium]
MKKLIILILLSLVYFANYAQNTPITFEAGENGANWTWTTFEAPAGEENPTFSVVTNPSIDATNGSAT